MDRLVYVICFFAVLISNISYFSFVQPTYVGWFFNASFILSIVFLFPKVNKFGYSYEKAYILLMIIGFLFHLIFTIENRIYDSAKWILPVILLMAGRKYSYKRVVFYGLMAFFFVNCFIAIKEYWTKQYFVDYFYTEEFSNSFERSSQFRAFGLMAHPLYSANIVLIIMGFLLVTKGINKNIRNISILLGSVALICFNSRAAMVIWAALLFYRFFLYNKKPIIAIFLGVLVYLFFISDAFSLLLQNSSGVLGRLSESNNLRDESTLTRLISFVIFSNQRWGFEDIVAGGRIFYLPGTEVSLENGLLLTLAWWGWIIGPLKVIFEIVISWKCLNGYDVKDKMIIFLSTWVCAYSNNNTVNTFVLVFFIISLIGIKYYTDEWGIEESRKKYKYI